MNSSDRRRRQRLPLKRVIRHSFYQVLGTPVFQENSTLDLSTRGLSFETAHEYKKGDLVLLELELDDVNTRLLVVVAWVKKTEDRFQIGAELIAIDPTHQEHLQTVLGKMIRRAKPVVSKGNKSKQKSASKKKKTAKKAPAKKSVVKKQSVKKRKK